VNLARFGELIVLLPDLPGLSGLSDDRQEHDATT
jgi:hypothetical protein